MRKVDVGRKILGANQEHAARNSELLAKHGLFCLNMISSPGSGKTTILARTICDLKSELKIGVIEGDIQTEIDAERIRAADAVAVQINTEGACHLSAAQVGQALKELPLDELDLIFIENVGNIICPADFPLGSHKRVVVLSLTEGPYVVLKHPFSFIDAEVVAINKVDLSSAVGVEPIELEQQLLRLKPALKVVRTNCVTGEGIAEVATALGF